MIKTGKQKKTLFLGVKKEEDSHSPYPESTYLTQFSPYRHSVVLSLYLYSDFVFYHHPTVSGSLYNQPYLKTHTYRFSGFRLPVYEVFPYQSRTLQAYYD